MKKSITLIELVKFYGIDEKDNERIEDRWIVGYFFNKKRIKQALALCKKKKKDDEEIVITQFEMECSPNQKYVYILFYEYSIIVDNQFQDFYEYFKPQSTFKKCTILKKKLMDNERYQINSIKIYDESIDGFHVEKIKIDYISYINYH